MHSVFNPPHPSVADNRLTWGNLHGSAAALAVSELAQHAQTPLLIVTPDVQEARRWQHALHFFNAHRELPVLLFPDWETLPYDHFSPHNELTSERLLTLYKLSQLKQGYIIVALPTLMHRLLPSSFLQQHALMLQCKQRLDLTQFRQHLVQSGYRHTEQVMEHGEFALRGSILDLFPMGSHTPFRIELFDDEIESIRHFDPDTQRSSDKIDQIELLPAREFPLSDEGITHFRNQWRANFSGNPSDAPTYVSISHGEAAPGIEYYLPLFFDKLNTLFDYLPPKTELVFTDQLMGQAEKFWQEVMHRYEQLRYDVTRPLCEPTSLFIPTNELFQQMKDYLQIHLRNTPDSGKAIQFNTDVIPDVRVEHKAANPLAKIVSLMQSTERVLFCAESSGRREILLDLLQQQRIHPRSFSDWQSFISSDEKIGITVTPLDAGFYLLDPNVALITEAQLFGEQVLQRRLRHRPAQDPATLIKNLTELHPGSPVVHLQHGIGRYRGLSRLTTGGIEAEYITLEYDNNDLVYVPVSSLHLISRYTGGGDADKAPLHRLGSKQWEKAKQLAAKRVRDTAAELLAIYSQRQATPGFPFAKPTQEYDLFASSFPFEETPDQLHAIQEVIKDMTSERCMDRLVCGDVGFGKTEVAMRAAFLAAQGGKQVAILVPTTLLANQHSQNFQDRFADWPIKVASLSRLRSKKEQDATLAGLAEGKVDIIIGTHKLLQAGIKFKDLGLLIVDEEHRFGVRDKERIKALRNHVDILTLTATPIPRTLNMALSGTRDLSIIATPPVRRLSIKTFVIESNPSILREAMLRETSRGGQIYFLHNKVETIHATAEKLQQILPEARLAIAHGQMNERELERVMADFYHQKCNVLLSTTIIESGIDVPNANTIIIDRADRFGLAQLHQLRGRVGRSHHQAYAYMLIPDAKAITKDAQLRLDAISKLEDLGSGFNLATHDLEIRGAGEFLGEEQSGHIHEIGFSLFTEMLEQAVAALKEGKEFSLEESSSPTTEIDLQVSALLPEDYVHDAYLRLTLYKRLASCKDSDEIQNFKAELIDRFGTLPTPTKNLLRLTELKLLATPMGITKIDLGKQFGYINFSDKPHINPATIVNLIQKQSRQYQLQGGNKLRFVVPEKISDNERIDLLQQVLLTLKD